MHHYVYFRCLRYLLKIINDRHWARYVQLNAGIDIASVEDASGAVLGPHFPRNTWLLCADRVAAMQIARIPGVAWVGLRPASHKLAEALHAVEKVGSSKVN